MPYFNFFWNDAITEHLADNDVTPAEFEYVVKNPERTGKSQSSGRDAAWAHLPDGRYVIAIYEMLDDMTVLPVTAYEV